VDNFFRVYAKSILLFTSLNLASISDPRRRADFSRFVAQVCRLNPHQVWFARAHLVWETLSYVPYACTERACERSEKNTNRDLSTELIHRSERRGKK